MTLAIISRDDAKAAGLKRYFTGLPCKAGHVDERAVSNHTCFACMRARALARYAENPAPAKAARLSRHRLNREASLASMQKYYAENRSKVLEQMRAAREAAPERRRAYSRQWAKENLARRREQHAHRRAAQMQATPPWLTEADRQAIRQIYTARTAIEAETGVPHHVDHIVPLRGKRICGLHVPGNLQVLPAAENMRKHNRFDG